MAIPNDEQIIRFAEGTEDLDEETQSVILQQVASSFVVRQHVAEIRRDLYLINCQIPEYSLSPEYLSELNKIAELWLKLKIERRFRLHNFLFGKEFLSIAIIAAMLLGLAVLILARLQY